MEICEVKIRNEFFISTLFVEDSITSYLSEKLDISDSINSKFLGNKKGALSFDQKIDALLDSDELSIIDKSKFSVYREINNELKLNKNVCSFEDCFTSSDSNDDFLLILYPQSEYLPREEKLTNACYQLIGEVSEILSKTTNKPEVKIRGIFKNFKINTVNLSRLTYLFSFLLIR